MSEQIGKEISIPKTRLKRFKEIFGKDDEFVINPEISEIDRTIMEIAEHPGGAEELANLLIEIIPFKKLMEKTGIDLEKEKELNEERTKEILELSKKQIETNEELAKAISDLNNKGNFFSFY